MRQASHAALLPRPQNRIPRRMPARTSWPVHGANRCPSTRTGPPLYPCHDQILPQNLQRRKPLAQPDPSGCEAFRPASPGPTHRRRSLASSHPTRFPASPPITASHPPTAFHPLYLVNNARINPSLPTSGLVAFPTMNAHSPGLHHLTYPDRDTVTSRSPSWIGPPSSHAFTRTIPMSARRACG